MKVFARQAATAALIVITGLATSMGAEQADGQFAARDGYDEANFGAQEITVTTPGGQKTVRITFSKLRVRAQARMATVRLPATGIALVQFTAGQGKFTAGRDNFAPLEGEWLRVPTPGEFGLGTDDDSVLANLILVEEIRR